MQCFSIQYEERKSFSVKVIYLKYQKFQTDLLGTLDCISFHPMRHLESQSSKPPSERNIAELLIPHPDSFRFEAVKTNFKYF